MSKSDHRAIQTLHALLQEWFPLAFPKHYDDLRPLKIGILTNLITRLPDVDPTALRRALANHIERKNREAKAVRKAEHKRVQREIVARKAALIAQGITPELRVERKRRLTRETVDQAVSSPEVGATPTTTDQWVRNFSPEVVAIFHRSGCDWIKIHRSGCDWI